MAKKNDEMNVGKRIYPISVRLIKPNPVHQDRIMYNNIELCTYKDTIIPNVETLMKIRPMEKYLIIKSEIEESNSEVIEDEAVEETD